MNTIWLEVEEKLGGQVILARALRSEDPSQAEEHPDPVDRAVHEGVNVARHRAA